LSFVFCFLFFVFCFLFFVFCFVLFFFFFFFFFVLFTLTHDHDLRKLYHVVWLHQSKSFELVGSELPKIDQSENAMVNDICDVGFCNVAGLGGTGINH